MKKIISLMLCVIMIGCCSVTAFAQDLIYDGSEGSATINYTVDSSYCVVIPETINGNDTYTFTATRMNLTANQQVNVYCKSVKSTEETITLTNEDGGTANFKFSGMKGDNCVGAFTNGQLESSFAVNGMVTNDMEAQAGTYTGTAEFTVQMSIKDLF